MRLIKTTSELTVAAVVYNHAMLAVCGNEDEFEIAQQLAAGLRSLGFSGHSSQIDAAIESRVELEAAPDSYMVY
jgi:outer membrane murein-binding lipoprotein Lpp